MHANLFCYIRNRMYRKTGERTLFGCRVFSYSEKHRMPKPSEYVIVMMHSKTACVHYEKNVLFFSKLRAFINNGYFVRNNINIIDQVNTYLWYFVPTILI